MHISHAECPECGDLLQIDTRHGDQMVECPECHTYYWAEYDADGECEIGVGVRWRGGYRLSRRERCQHPPGESCARDGA